MIGYRLDWAVSQARWAAPFAVVFSLVHTLSSTNWIGSASGTVLATTNSFTLAVPLFSAAAALDARRGLTVRAAPGIAGSARPLPWVVLARVGGTVTWVLSAYFVALLTAGAVNFAWTSQIRIPILQIAIGMVGITAYVCLGFLFGGFLPRTASIPLSLLIPYAIIVLLGVRTDHPAALFTTLDSGILPVGYSLRPTAAWGQLAWFGGVLTTVIAGLVVGIGRVRPAGLTGIVVLVTSISVTAGLGWHLAHLTGGRTQLAASAGPQACSPDGAVCVWREHSYLLPTAAALSHRMLAGSTRWRGGAPRFIELGLTSSYPASATFFSGRNRPTEDELAQSLASALLNEDVCASGSSDLSEPIVAREEWLVLRALPAATADDSTTAEVRQVLTRPPSQQWDWFWKIPC
jgi:hypothetical protein